MIYQTELRAPSQTLKRGSVGNEVKRLQEWLCLRGQGVSIDGEFGPATEAAAMKLLSTNEVTPELWPNVCAPLAAVVSVRNPMGASFGRLVTTVAELHLAQSPREAGGDNKGPWVRHYCRGYEVAWCQGFASTIWDQAGGSPVNLILDGIWCLYVPRMVTEFKSRGRFIPGNSHNEVPSGSMFFLRGGSAGYSHVGIVIDYNASNDTFTTIEGNTNDDGSANGYEVCRRVRHRSSCDFGRA